MVRPLEQAMNESLAKALDIMLIEGELPAPLWITERGDHIDTFFKGWDDEMQKAIILIALKKAFRLNGVNQYTLVFESWITDVDTKTHKERRYEGMHVLGVNRTGMKVTKVLWQYEVKRSTNSIAVGEREVLDSSHSFLDQLLD